VDYLVSLGSNVGKDDYKPRAKWVGYGEKGWPRIEDVSTYVEGGAYSTTSTDLNAAFPADAGIRLDMDRPVPPATGWRSWLPF
jgi:hypothetical protein